MQKGVEMKILGQTYKCGGKILGNPGSQKYKQLVASQSQSRLGGLSNVGPISSKESTQDIYSKLRQAMRRRLSQNMVGSNSTSNKLTSSKNSISVLDENTTSGADNI